MVDPKFRIIVDHILAKDYDGLAGLLDRHKDFAKQEGAAVVGAMYGKMVRNGEPFDYGWQLTGPQLKVLATVLKAGAPVGQGDLTVRFNYVAKFTPEDSYYIVEFPDLPGCITTGNSIDHARTMARETLQGYIATKMEHGDKLPEPKYRQRGASKGFTREQIRVTLAQLPFDLRGVKVRAVQGNGIEFQLAKKFVGTYDSLDSLQARIDEICSRELSPGNSDLDAPMHIHGYRANLGAIFARVDGTYGPNGTLVPHPGFEKVRPPYEIKVADVQVMVPLRQS